MSQQRALQIASLIFPITVSAAMAKESPPTQPTTTPDWAQVRTEVEATIIGRLIDPESAKIEWPYGFKWGGFKPLLQRRVHSWATCVMVNGRNRMGGYTGSTPAIVVYLDGVKYLEITDNQYGIDAEQCAKAGFPRPPLALTSHTSISGPVDSLADEIAKLAALRDKGILTSEQFEAQKAKLLNRE